MMIQYYNIQRLHKIYQWAGGCKSLLEGMQVNVKKGKKAKFQLPDCEDYGNISFKTLGNSHNTAPYSR
jgi:hypothetical protein